MATDGSLYNEVLLYLQVITNFDPQRNAAWQPFKLKRQWAQHHVDPVSLIMISGAIPLSTVWNTRDSVQPQRQ